MFYNISHMFNSTILSTRNRLLKIFSFTMLIYSESRKNNKTSQAPVVNNIKKPAKILRTEPQSEVPLVAKPDYYDKSKPIVEIIYNKIAYSSENTVKLLISIFTNKQFTPVTLLTISDEKSLTLKPEAVVDFFLAELLSMKFLMANSAFVLNKQNRNQNLNSDVIRSLLVTMLGMILQSQLESSEIKIAQKKILEEINVLIQLYFTKISNREVVQTEETTAFLAPLREAVISFFLLIVNDKDCKITIRGVEINKSILQNNLIIDLMVSVINIYVKNMTNRSLIKALGSISDEDFIKLMEDSKKKGIDKTNSKNNKQKTSSSPIDDGDDKGIF